MWIWAGVVGNWCGVGVDLVWSWLGFWGYGCWYGFDKDLVWGSVGSWCGYCRDVVCSRYGVGRIVVRIWLGIIRA